MKYLVFLLSFITSVMQGQNNIEAVFQNDSVIITNIVNSDADCYQMIFQNGKDASDAIYYWSEQPFGTFYSPYCNTWVTRTGFIEGVAYYSNTVKIEQDNPIVIKVWNNKAVVKITLPEGTFKVWVYDWFGKPHQLWTTVMNYPFVKLNKGQHQFTVQQGNTGYYVVVVEKQNYNGCNKIQSFKIKI